jgi:hypothetical protein
MLLRFLFALVRLVVVVMLVDLFYHVGIEAVEMMFLTIPVSILHAR